MFGMLDYRAHKLYWLFMIPISLSVFILSYAAVAGSFLYSISFTENVLVQIGLTLLLIEVTSLLLFFIYKILSWVISKFFYFIVDLVPSEGRNKDEAKAVLIGGDLIRFTTKLKYQPSLFDYEDQLAFTRGAIRSQGWIVRLFRLLGGSSGRSVFGSTMEERIDAIVDEAKVREHDPEDLHSFVDSEAASFLKELGIHPTKFEEFLANAQIRHMIYRYLFLVICFIVYLLNKSPN